MPWIVGFLVLVQFSSIPFHFTQCIIHTNVLIAKFLKPGTRLGSIETRETNSALFSQDSG